MVDLTPPLLGYIGDGLEGDIAYQSDATMLCINGGGFSDPESGVAEILWAIGEESLAYIITQFPVRNSQFPQIYFHTYSSTNSLQFGVPNPQFTKNFTEQYSSQSKFTIHKLQSTIHKISSHISEFVQQSQSLILNPQIQPTALV